MSQPIYTVYTIVLFDSSINYNVAALSVCDRSAIRVTNVFIDQNGNTALFEL